MCVIKTPVHFQNPTSELSCNYKPVSLYWPNMQINLDHVLVRNKWKVTTSANRFWGLEKIKQQIRQNKIHAAQFKNIWIFPLSIKKAHEICLWICKTANCHQATFSRRSPFIESSLWNSSHEDTKPGNFLTWVIWMHYYME